MTDSWVAFVNAVVLWAVGLTDGVQY
ncbi:uncharacterized protein G2W53_031488 [Senna tora]|uniref:Uncharacterized protein n=1 Tax=Senna tora TaxID=362788 RepID=A0A834WHT2_9FABA|nr:uncharacterized protein G2W53_031488 [Senna tora]